MNSLMRFAGTANVTSSFKKVRYDAYVKNAKKDKPSPKATMDEYTLLTEEPKVLPDAERRSIMDLRNMDEVMRDYNQLQAILERPEIKAMIADLPKTVKIDFLSEEYQYNRFLDKASITMKDKDGKDVANTISRTSTQLIVEEKYMKKRLFRQPVEKSFQNNLGFTFSQTLEEFVNAVIQKAQELALVYDAK